MNKRLMSLSIWALFLCMIISLNVQYTCLARYRLNLKMQEQRRRIEAKAREDLKKELQIRYSSKSKNIIINQSVKQEDEKSLETEEFIEEINEDLNYHPTDEEREFAYKLAYAEAGIEDSLGQTLVINTSINNMRARGFSNLLEEFNEKGRYYTVRKGEVYVITQSGKRLVTEEDLTDELKEAVDEAFRKDYTEELLKEAAVEKAQNSSFKFNPKYYEGGSLYFYNPYALSEENRAERENIRVKFQHGRHVFYRKW